MVCFANLILSAGGKISRRMRFFLQALHAQSKAGVILAASLWAASLSLADKLIFLCGVWFLALVLDWRACLKTWRRLAPMALFVLVANAWSTAGEALWHVTYSPTKAGLYIAGVQCFYLFWFAACMRILWCILTRAEWLYLLTLLFSPLNVLQKQAAQLWAWRLNLSLEALEFYLSTSKISWDFVQQEIQALKSLAQTLAQKPNDAPTNLQIHQHDFLYQKPYQAADGLIFVGLVLSLAWLCFK